MIYYYFTYFTLFC